MKVHLDLVVVISTKNIKRVISLTFKQGIGEAEEELGVDVGVDVNFDNKMNTYNINELQAKDKIANSLV